MNSKKSRDWIGVDGSELTVPGVICCRDKFLAALMRALSLPAADPEDIQVRCLKAVLGEKSKDPTLHDQVPFAPSPLFDSRPF